ncbi:nuclease-related domain-containing protein [Bacillus pinisoli]|uniref:nuclease-related domain-containing protein n=1 Tax=Bacillus pinisoli TaxID=2901866 RepID=UPI001FF23BCD|nr:nuclease-related domain-containing protein [Bacillus pinisoli]
MIRETIKKYPVHLRKLEALSRRLNPNHINFQKVVDNFGRQKSGYQGERVLDYHLSYLPEKEYVILHGLRFFDGIGFFQIDVLILSKYYFLILEVKNIKGTLLFDPEFNQLIRIEQEKEEAFPDPLLQVDRQKRLLKNFLSAHINITDIPIYTLVVISNPSTIIKATTAKKQILQRVIHSAKLHLKIEELNKLYVKEILSASEIQKVGKQLVKKNQTLDSDLLQYYEIKRTDILKGVQCPECLNIPMCRFHSNWVCPKCNNKSRMAHIPALVDYSLFFGTCITNRQARNFLQVSSNNVVRYLLSSLDLPTTGKNKSKTYNLAYLLSK